MTTESLIAAASFSPISLEFPDAWAGHIPFAAWAIQQISPKIFVELGTHSGNSYFSFCQSVAEARLPTKCYAVDTWQGDEHAGQYDDEIFAKVHAHNQERYASFSRLLRTTFDDASAYFDNESVDLLHIDGLHTYDAVRHDFETWLPKLAPGAVVLFHDTNVRERNFGVWKLWAELQARYPNNLEFVHSHGLGVLQLDNAPREKKLRWLEPNGADKQNLRTYFAALGARQSEHFELQGLKDQVATLTRAVADRDERICSTDQALTKRDEQIGSLNAAISDCIDHIDNLDRTIAESGRQIVHLNTTVVESGKQIAGMAETVTARDDVTTSSNLAAIAHDEHIKSLSEALATLNRIVAERDTEIASVNQALAALNTGIAERDWQIGSLHESTSWRCTAPLRFFGRNAKRVRRVAEIALPAIERGGGLKNTLGKAIQLYRRDGMAGIKRGFRHVATAHERAMAAPIEQRPNDYTEWIRRYDTITDQSRSFMLAKIKDFSCTPLISVVMPTFNPKVEWLIEAIESVRKQIYPHWELCIADDASTDAKIRQILERYANDDERIKVTFREKNGHISASSNTALQLSTGDWVALLDHDDLLSEHALYWVAEKINKHPDAMLVYSDEDKLDEAGNRFEPYFKCDWNLDLFYSHNLISHLGVYRTSIVKEIGGFREGFEGSQDHDLALRFIERIEAHQIHHIHRVLYHWRVHEQSTARAAQAKPYAVVAGEKALNDHFRRTNVAATVAHDGCGYRMRHALPSVSPKVSLIIPTRNGLRLIRTCVESILKTTTYQNYEIIIVDNGSDDPLTLDYFKKLQSEPKVQVMRDDRPFNYSALNNTAIQRLATGEILGLLNNDLEVISPDWLSEMVSHVIRPGVGAVGAKLWYPNDTLQHGGVILGLGGVAGHAHSNVRRHQHGYFGRASVVQSFSAVTAACLVVKKSIYQEVGGLNEVDLQVAFNDVDFCLRLREAGYRNVWTPYAELYHYESATRGHEDTPEKLSRFSREVEYMERRWGDELRSDPAYSPNLSLEYSFSLAWPPRTKEYLSISTIQLQNEKLHS